MFVSTNDSTQNNYLNKVSNYNGCYPRIIGVIHSYYSLSTHSMRYPLIVGVIHLEHALSTHNMHYCKTHSRRFHSKRFTIFRTLIRVFDSHSIVILYFVQQYFSKKCCLKCVDKIHLTIELLYALKMNYFRYKSVSVFTLALSNNILHLN